VDSAHKNARHQEAAMTPALSTVEAAPVLAFGLKATTTTQRVLAVQVGALILLPMLALMRRWFARSFFHGFLVAVGTFLSFDIVLFHWVFKLHRITSGQEANVIEPLLVALGIGFVAYGVRRERPRPERRS
jgi:hypothetical protein